MPKSLPTLPELREFVGTELTYVMENSGAPDRDKKATLESIRRFCTSQGVRFLEVSLGAVGTLAEVDITGTTNVVVAVWGSFSATDNRVNIHGTIPEGCYAVVINGSFALLDLMVNGNAVTDDPADLDFGTFGRAEMVSHSGALLTTIVNDSRWNKQTRSAAILVETTRAQSAEGSLADMILGEASQRQDDITETQSLISAEVDRATAAEEALAYNLGRLSQLTSQRDFISVLVGPASQGHYVSGPALPVPATVGIVGVGPFLDSADIISSTDSLRELCTSEVVSDRKISSLASVLVSGQKSMASSVSVDTATPSSAGLGPALLLSRSVKGIRCGFVGGATQAALDIRLPAPIAGVAEEITVDLLIDVADLSLFIFRFTSNDGEHAYPAIRFVSGESCFRIRNAVADQQWVIDGWSRVTESL